MDNNRGEKLRISQMEKAYSKCVLKTKPLKWKANDKPLQKFTTFLLFPGISCFISIFGSLLGFCCTHLFEVYLYGVCVCAWAEECEHEIERERKRASEFACLALHYRSIIVLRVRHIILFNYFATDYNFIHISSYCYIENTVSNSSSNSNSSSCILSLPHRLNIHLQNRP